MSPPDRTSDQPTPEGFAGRHAIVTGGGRGIGRAIAGALKQRGATVTILGRDRAGLERAVAEGIAHGFAQADVTRRDEVLRAVADSVALRGPADLLVANAGSAASAPFMKSGEDIFRQMLDVNLMGVVNAVQAVLGPMTERGYGRIVAVASTAGLKGYGYVSAYCAAKHAVIGLVRSLAVEAARTGVTVNAVCPGYADTDLTAASLDRIVDRTGRPRDAVLDEILRPNPQGRLVRPDEVADCVLWLCGANAGAVTGQAIAVAGGEV
jgi:NAD(P)-dependent dehydrogenase (short-subunit alcohol dehydrogenase family)